MSAGAPGWAIPLKAMLEKQCTASYALNNQILLVMLLVSLTLGLGGFIVDQNYARRKFRVIYALDQLMFGIVQSKGQVHKNLQQIATTLQVSEDKSDDNYRKVSGYAHEATTSRVIFLLPMVIAGAAVFVLWK
jgi:hypothetical protein